MSWRVVLAITRKDLLDAIRNLYVLSALVLPVVLSLLFKLAFADPNQGLASTVVVHDPGGSRLTAELRANPELKVVEVSSSDQLAVEVEKQGVAGLDVPDAFDAGVLSGARPELTVYLNRGRGGGEIASFERLLERQLRALAGQELPARLSEVSVGGNVIGQALGSINLEAYLLVMLLVLALAMSGTFVVPTLLVEEKEKHTLDVLLVSPASVVDVVVGKGLVGLVYCGLGSLVLILLNHGWLGAWPLTLLTLVLGSAFLVVVGLLMGSLFRNTGQVNTWSSLVMMILILPTWFTLSSQSSPFTTALRLVPTFYLAEALGFTLSGNLDWGRLGLDLAVLATCTAAALGGVVWLLRREGR